MNSRIFREMLSETALADCTSRASALTQHTGRGFSASFASKSHYYPTQLMELCRLNDFEGRFHLKKIGFSMLQSFASVVSAFAVYETISRKYCLPAFEGFSSRISNFPQQIAPILKFQPNHSTIISISPLINSL